MNICGHTWCLVGCCGLAVCCRSSAKPRGPDGNSQRMRAPWGSSQKGWNWSWVLGPRQGKEATGPWVGGMGGMSSLFDFWHLIPQVNPCQFSQGAGKLFAGTQGESMLSLLMSNYSFQKLEIWLSKRYKMNTSKFYLAHQGRNQWDGKLIQRVVKELGYW